MKIEAASLAGLDGVRHGFCGRTGGVSEGPFASLNVGLRSGDAPDRVRRNRAIAAAALGAEPDRLVLVRQIHGTRCIAVERPWPAAVEPPDADALVTTVPGLAIGVLTADCAPVLAADPAAGVIGAAHAGWRGALSGVLEAMAAAMVNAGADPARIAAAIGPCIAQASYEVGEDYRDLFLARDRGSLPFFAPSAASGRPHFDLAGYCAMRLRRAGVPAVECLGIDTCADAARFFSHRRSSKQADRRFGLQLSAILLAA